jgi:tRNA modification GTPase
LAGHEVVAWVSPRNGEGVEDLRALLLERVDVPEDGIVVVHRRHVDALGRAEAALERLRAAHQEGVTLDVLALELEEATHALGAILGRNVDVAVLDRIFSQFCIGK